MTKLYRKQWVIEPNVPLFPVMIDLNLYRKQWDICCTHLQKGKEKWKEYALQLTTFLPLFLIFLFTKKNFLISCELYKWSHNSKLFFAYFCQMWTKKQSTEMFQTLTLTNCMNMQITPPKTFIYRVITKQSNTHFQTYSPINGSKKVMNNINIIGPKQ